MTLRSGLVPASLVFLMLVAVPVQPIPPIEPAPAPEQMTVEVAIGNGHGTGVVVRPGLVLTAAHVVSDATGIEVVFHDGRREPGSLAWISEAADIAAIFATTGPAPVAKLACRAPAVGEVVMTIGYPGPLRAIRSWGRIAGWRSGDDGPATAVLDVTTFVGASGGPVFDAEGRLVGIVQSIMGILTIPTGMPAPTGYAFMVPASTLCRLGL